MVFTTEATEATEKTFGFFIPNLGGLGGKKPVSSRPAIHRVPGNIFIPKIFSSLKKFFREKNPLRHIVGVYILGVMNRSRAFS